MTYEHADTVLLGALAIDYLTLVTPEITRATQMFQLLTYGLEERYTGDPHSATNVNTSCGPYRIATIPRQKPANGRVLNVHGLTAHYKAEQIGELIPPGHISRIDLQVTVPLETEVDMAGIYHVLSNPNKYPWKQTGKPPIAQYFQNTEGGETIYIGKRTSDLLTRIYRKRVEGQDCLRWELEIKGRLARGLQEQNILSDPHVRATFARAVLAGYPDAVQASLEMFAERIDEPTGEVSRKRAEADDDATLLWFRRTVVPALKKAMRGKLREEVLELLREEDYYLTSYQEYDKFVKERDKKARQVERKYKNLYERARTR
jgi:hypothetical protein